MYNISVAGGQISLTTKKAALEHLTFILPLCTGFTLTKLT